MQQDPGFGSKLSWLMARNHVRTFMFSFMFCVLLPVFGRAQSFNATVSGTITDPSGGVMPGVELTLTSIGTSAVRHVTSDPTGFYTFPNLGPGAYELKAIAKGFRDYVQRGIAVSMNQSVRLDVRLELGAATQTLEVTANASPLNFESAEIKQAVTPATIRELPLLVAGTIRSASSFILLMPGVSTGAGGAPFDARINGGLQTGDEAVVDGVSMQEGLMSQTGMIAFSDYPISPESVEEVSVLTSNYEPQYGSTTSAVITATTRSGTNDFHGGVHWFHRNTVLNARQYGVAERPKDLENDFGVFVGGPVKLPFLWSGRRKTFFFFNYTGFRIVGSLTKPIQSVPTEKMRDGDFSEWPYPIYDPATTQPDPNNPGSFLRDQFMGCDPINDPQPNVICPDRIANSLALQWLQYVPLPNRAGVLNNYESPFGPINPSFKNSNSQVYRFDHYLGDKDHFSAVLRYRGTFGIIQSQLPQEIATDNYRHPDWNVIARVLWDRTFSPTVLNHLALGFTNFRSTIINISDCCVNKVPAITGVANHLHQPLLQFEQYASYGGNSGSVEDHPTAIINDLVTWVRGKHTFKLGMEYRRLRDWLVPEGNAAGTFNFSRLNTGLIGTTSGNAMASFLLEAVDNANVAFRTVRRWEMEGNTWILHFGDTWKVSPKLSINYGIRWDRASPSQESNDHLSFFDPLGANPAAGGRLGRLAFAGTKWGPASFGRRHPETTWNKAFAPRLGVAYSWSPKTVIRAGYGVFYTQAFYPGWGGGSALDGFDAYPSFGSTLGGMQPAFILSQGFPQDFTPPPFVDSGYRNGQDLTYRPFDANRLSNTQQWNLTIERQFTDNFYISASYVGNKGTRLPSTTAPLNALDPSLLSMGSALYDEFQAGDTEVDGVPLPYPGWVEHMTGCAPSVAQALLPYPQYCSRLQGLNENAGNSIYHSFQFKAEKRFSRGVWLLASYTLSKLLTSSDFTQSSAYTWSGAHGVISPYERQRNKALAVDDVPQVLSLAFVYDLPFGKGKRFLNTGGAVDKVLGGWRVTNILRATSGIPFFFRSAQCNVPAQFAVGCIPAILPGANPWAQDLGNLDPNKPLFNSSAFEDPNSFDFYYGKGPRISNLRGFGYHNHDFGLIKTTRVTERVSFEFRTEFFNIWNWHIFAVPGSTNYNSVTAFDTSVGSPTFGMWNGSVSVPRNIQFGAKILF